MFLLEKRKKKKRKNTTKPNSKQFPLPSKKPKYPVMGILFWILRKGIISGTRTKVLRTENLHSRAVRSVRHVELKMFASLSGIHWGFFVCLFVCLFFVVVVLFCFALLCFFFLLETVLGYPVTFTDITSRMDVHAIKRGRPTLFSLFFCISFLLIFALAFPLIK